MQGTCCNFVRSSAFYRPEGSVSWNSPNYEQVMPWETAILCLSVLVIKEVWISLDKFLCIETWSAKPKHAQKVTREKIHTLHTGLKNHTWSGCKPFSSMKSRDVYNLSPPNSLDLSMSFLGVLNRDKSCRNSWKKSCNRCVCHLASAQWKPTKLLEARPPSFRPYSC